LALVKISLNTLQSEIGKVQAIQAFDNLAPSVPINIVGSDGKTKVVTFTEGYFNVGSPTSNFLGQKTTRGDVQKIPIRELKKGDVGYEEAFNQAAGINKVSTSPYDGRYDPDPNNPYAPPPPPAYHGDVNGVPYVNTPEGKAEYAKYYEAVAEAQKRQENSAESIIFRANQMLKMLDKSKAQYESDFNTAVDKWAAAVAADIIQRDKEQKGTAADVASYFGKPPPSDYVAATDSWLNDSSKAAQQLKDDIARIEYEENKALEEGDVEKANKLEQERDNKQAALDARNEKLNQRIEKVNQANEDAQVAKENLAARQAFYNEGHKSPEQHQALKDARNFASEKERAANEVFREFYQNGGREAMESAKQDGLRALYNSGPAYGKPDKKDNGHSYGCNCGKCQNETKDALKKKEADDKKRKEKEDQEAEDRLNPTPEELAKAAEEAKKKKEKEDREKFLKGLLELIVLLRKLTQKEAKDLAEKLEKFLENIIPLPPISTPIDLLDSRESIIDSRLLTESDGISSEGELSQGSRPSRPGGSGPSISGPSVAGPASGPSVSL